MQHVLLTKYTYNPNNCYIVLLDIYRIIVHLPHY